MDSDERQHYQSLLQLHQQQLRRIELNVVGFGALNVPGHLEHELEAELAAIVRLQAILNPPSPASTPADASPDIHLVDDTYYPELLKRYGITILQIIDATTYVIACNHCDGAGRRPHTVIDWEVRQWYEKPATSARAKA